MSTVLFAQAAGEGAASDPFTLTEPTLVALTGQVNGLGAAMAIKFDDANGAEVARLTGAESGGVLPAGTFVAVRVGPHSIGLKQA